MNSMGTSLTSAETNSSSHADSNDIWPTMNDRRLYENTSTILPNKNYYFEPIDHDFTSNSIPIQTNNSHLIQRPVPISNHHSNTVTERSRKQQYVSQMKRNSTINSSDVDSTIRSHALPRSMTSDQLSKNATAKKLYYYPSVQDVLDALNRRSFEKESFV